jgi:hypothetical protein
VSGRAGTDPAGSDHAGTDPAGSDGTAVVDARDTPMVGPVAVFVSDGQ